MPAAAISTYLVLDYIFGNRIVEHSTIKPTTLLLMFCNRVLVCNRRVAYIYTTLLKKITNNKVLTN